MHIKDQLVDPILQGVNRLFVLSFENDDDRRWHSKVTINGYNVMIDGKFFFD